MHGHSFDQGALMMVWIPQLSILQVCFAIGGAIMGVAFVLIFWQIGYQRVAYITTLRSRVKDRLGTSLWLLLSLWSSSDLNLHSRGGSIRLVPLSHAVVMTLGQVGFL